MTPTIPNKPRRTTIVINLAGSLYDADQAIVEEELEKIPGAIEASENLKDMHIRVGEVSLAYPEQVEQLKARLIQDDPKLKWVVLFDEYPAGLDGGLRETLGWYSPDTRGSAFSVVVETELKKNIDPKQKELLEQLKKQLKEQRGTVGSEPVPIVALVMGAINRESQEWIKKPGGFHELDCYPAHEQRRWLTVKVLRHEIGHHVFQLHTEEYSSYGGVTKETYSAEAGANWFSWLIGSSEDRIILEKFTKKQEPPYRAYQELITLANDPVGTQPCQLVLGYWAVTLLVFGKSDLMFSALQGLLQEENFRKNLQECHYRLISQICTILGNEYAKAFFDSCAASAAIDNLLKNHGLIEPLKK